MAKSKAQQIFEGVKLAAGVAAEVVKDVVNSKPATQMGNEILHQVEAGAHEVASAIFTGAGYIQYPRQGENQKEDPLHGPPADAKQPEVQQEQDRGMEL